MVSTDNISSQVDLIIVEAAHIAGSNTWDQGQELSGDLNLTSDFGFDSLDVVELVSALETKFDLEIPDAVFKVSTVAELRAFVASLLLVEQKT